MFKHFKHLFFIPFFSLLVFGLSGCNEESASEKLAKKQLESISEAEKKKKQGQEAIQNNTVNPFSFDENKAKEK